MAARLQADGPADRGIYAQNRWAALRFGIEAELVHPDGSRLASAAELFEELSAHLGVDGVDPFSQADEQLEIGRAEGLSELCRRLVSLT
jgi:gamma-glutamyl:cysteine ligase YbdK (ATP-grasp superfamily)